MGKGWMCLSDRCRNDDDDHTKRSKYRQFRERRKLADLCGTVFASLTAILGKIGISGVDSNLGTAIRTTVVLVMAWLMVFMKGKQHEVRQIEKKELLFIGLSGIATGASWLCYYRALQEGPASVVVPIDKLSILVTIAFSWIVFHEKLTRKSAVGVVLITVGTVLMTMV